MDLSNCIIKQDSNSRDKSAFSIASFCLLAKNESYKQFAKNSIQAIKAAHMVNKKLILNMGKVS